MGGAGAAWGDEQPGQEDVLLRAVNVGVEASAGRDRPVERGLKSERGIVKDELLTSAWATTAEALPSAFACLRMANASFREGVVLAGNFARDADTIGAVAGAILGAKYGVGGIPAAWVEKTRYPTGTCLQCTAGMDIREMAGQLAALIR